MKLSTRTTNTLTRANITTSDLSTMSIEELTAIKGVGPKMIIEIQAALTEENVQQPMTITSTESGRIPIESAKTHPDTAILFSKPEIETTWITAGDLINAKANLLMTSKVTETLEAS